jgi:hypothetical protein
VKSDDPQQAIRLFEKVVELETKQGDQVKWFVCLIVNPLMYKYASFILHIL